MLDVDKLVKGAPVEWLRSDNPELGIRHGQLGRVSLPHPEDVFVDWFGVSNEVLANHAAYDMEDLGHLTEDEFQVRADRVRRGLPRTEG